MPELNQLRSQALRVLSRSSLLQRALENVWPQRLQQVGRRIVEQTEGRWPTLHRLLQTAFDSAERWIETLESPSTRPGPQSSAQSSALAAAMGEVIETATSVQSAKGEDVDAPKLQQLANSTEWSQRLAAIKAISAVDDALVVTALVTALIDPSIEVAVAAAEKLARSTRAHALKALQSLVDHRDGYVSPLTRVAALRALSANDAGRVLGAIRDLDAEVSLAAISILAEPNGPVTRQQAIEALRAVKTDGTGFYTPVVYDAATRALEQLERVTA